MQVRLWGVRGSIPVPGPETVTYGGNTSCIEVRFPEVNRFIIIDSGTGIRPLGGYLLQNDLPLRPIHTQLFLTHTHWDHIMGYPFFVPIYIRGTKLDVYGPVTYEDDTLDEIVGGQLRYRYFPVLQSELAAEINYYPLQETVLDLGDGITVTTKYLNHPILCLGYRIEFNGKVFCTAYDTEPFRNLFQTNPEAPDYDPVAAEEGEAAAEEENRKVREFFSNADLLIHDTQYTQKEYLGAKIGWGHTSYEYAINAAHRAKVKHLLLFHHDPLRSDEQLEQILDFYKSRIGGRSNMKVAIAREGSLLEI